MSRSRWPALAVLCAGALMAIVDETIVAVSLPVIARDLGFSAAGVAWVTGAYLIAFAGLLLLCGRLGDLLGRTRVFGTGLAVFAVASLLCGLAWSPEVLVAMRFVQGIGGAALTAVILGMIVTLFPEPRGRAKAIGAFSFVQASGGTMGTLAGGFITQVVSWNWIFFVNVPIGLVCLVLAARLLPADRGLGVGRGADVAGAVLVTGTLMVGVYTVITVEHHGWASAHTFGFGTLSLTLLAAFVLRQATATDPLLPLRVLRSRRVAGGNVVMFLLVAAMFGYMFLTALNLRHVVGYSPAQTGLALVPTPVVIAVISLGFSARLNTRFGEWRVLLVGTTLIAGGFVLFGRMPVDAVYAVDILPGLFLFGAGAGMALPALMTLGMSDSTPSDSGLASGLFNTTQQVGGALGLSVLVVVAATRTDDLLAVGRPEQVALLGGYHVAYRVAAGLALAALAVAATVLRPRPVAPPTTGPTSIHEPARTMDV